MSVSYTRLFKMTVKHRSFHGVDLTGYTSGRLTIRGLLGRKVYAKGSQVYVWLADCTCGASGIPVNGSHFLNGGIKSCGCLAKEASAASKLRNTLKSKGTSKVAPLRLSAADVRDRGKFFKDYSGMRFGKLVVNELVGGVLYWSGTGAKALSKHLVTHWSCTCDCGVSTERSSTYFYKKGAIFACHKCIRSVDRTQPRVLCSR